MNRQAAAYARIGDGSELAFNLLDIDPFTPVQDPQMGSLPGSPGQLRQPAFRLLPNIHRAHDKMTALDQLHAEAILTILRVLIDIAVKLEGFQQRVEGTLAQPHQFADVGDLKLGGLLVEQVEDLQNAGMSTLELRRKRTFFGVKNQ